MKFKPACAQFLRVIQDFKTMASLAQVPQVSGVPVPQPAWDPRSGCQREQAAWQMGMTVPPFSPCSSMAKRVPHLSGLMLLEALKPVYFKNAGNKAHFEFWDCSGGSPQWLIERHWNNARDEDVTRDAYGDSLRKNGFCQAARSDAVFKEPPPQQNMHPQFRYSLAAATIIEALKNESTQSAHEPQIQLSLRLGVEAYDVVHNAPDDVDFWLVKDRSRSLCVLCVCSLVCIVIAALCRSCSVCVCR